MNRKLLITLVLLLVSGFGTAYCQKVRPLSNVGDIDELKQSLKGKVLLMNFWATWCKPCVKEFPDLVNLYKENKEKGFELVFISADVPEDVDPKVKPFLKKNGVDFVTYYINFDKAEDLINYIDSSWEGAIPSTYIYDREGVLKVKIVGKREYSEFESEINKYLY